METLCRPPIPRPLKPKAGTKRDGQTKSRTKPPHNNHFAKPLDHPDTFWRCPFCPGEYNTFLALKAHNNEYHGGKLFRLECGQCGFQPDSPKLLRKHQIRINEVKELNTPDEIVAATPANESAAAIPTSSTCTRAKDWTKGLLCRETLRNNPVAHGDEETAPPHLTAVMAY